MGLAMVGGERMNRKRQRGKKGKKGGKRSNSWSLCGSWCSPMMDESRGLKIKEGRRKKEMKKKIKLMEEKRGEESL